MIFSRYPNVIFFAVVLLAMAGCPGYDENQATSGLTVHIAEVHVEEQLSKVNKLAMQSVSPVQQQVASVASISERALNTVVTGGYDHDHLESHEIIDGNHHLVSMYRAYLVIDNFKLVPCTRLSQLPRLLLNSIIPSADAHAGHGAEPVAGRSLDKPNVIDIVTRDEYYLPLGNLAVAPGNYCGVQVSFARLADEPYGKPKAAPASEDDPITSPEIPNLSGKMFALRADYCSTPDGAGGCAGRSRVDIDDTGLNLPVTQTVDFDKPLTLSTSHNDAYIAVGIAYGAWLHNIDVQILASDNTERQKLINNIAASIHVYANGIGDIPPNIDP